MLASRLARGSQIPDPPNQNEQDVFKRRAPAFLKQQKCPAYLKQCDEYVSRVLCPAFVNFGYAPWAEEVEEMYGSDLERYMGKGEFGVRLGNGDMMAEAGTSTPEAGSSGTGRATRARPLAGRANPMEVRRTFYCHSERRISDHLTEAPPRLCRVRKARSIVCRT